MALVEISDVNGCDVVAVAALADGHRWRLEGVDPARVTTLAGRVASWPPILVNRADLTVVDGVHRVSALRRLGLLTVRVEWFEGSFVEAFMEFDARNERDGTPLTADDRKWAASCVVDAEPEWSDRRIAHICGVSPKIVARLRPPGSDATSFTAHDRRIGRDGRARPLQPGAVRRDIAAAIRESPCASLRAIATQVGVSPETVRSVRRELSGRDEACESPRAMTVAMRSPQVAQAPWRDGHAFGSTEAGTTFLNWFESTSVAEAPGRAGEVPLSRVYEIADEARHRARFWADFADAVEGRSRPRRSS